jgi:hypothetical protein
VRLFYESNPFFPIGLEIPLGEKPDQFGGRRVKSFSWPKQDRHKNADGEPQKSTNGSVFIKIHSNLNAGCIKINFEMYKNKFRKFNKASH